MSCCWNAVNGRKGFDAIEPAWTRLVALMRHRRFFQFPAWHGSYAHHLETEPDNLWYITAHRGGELVGIFPMRVGMRQVAGLRWAVLESITHPHLNLADFVFDRAPENGGLVGDLIRWLRRQRMIAWDTVDLGGIPLESAVTWSLGKSRPTLMVERLEKRSSYVSCRDAYDVATATVSGSFKRNLRRLARRAEETAALSFHSLCTPQDVAAALPHFFEIEASGWKGGDGAGSAIACDPALTGYYRELATRFALEGNCAINVLRLGEQVVAAQFALQVDGTLSLLKIGYRETCSALAPGNLIMERTIRRCCESGDIHTLSFVTSPEWGHLWKPRQEPVFRYRIFNNTARAWALYALARTKGLLVRRSSTGAVTEYETGKPAIDSVGTHKTVEKR